MPAGPGSLLSTTGGDAGGIIKFNSNASNIVHLSSNTFDTGCSSENANKSYHPSASRAGSKIAFASNRNGATDGTGYRIFVMNGDGTGVRQLTFDPGPTAGEAQDFDQDTNPVVSPDGTRVAFISRRNTSASHRNANIFIVNTDGTGAVQQVTLSQLDTGETTPRSQVLSVVWSPDATRLAFKGSRLASDGSETSPNIHMVLGLINADGTGESTLAIVDSTGISAGIDWSPDGRYIVTAYGREAQGAPPFRVLLFNLQSNTSKEILQEGTFPINDGGLIAGSGAFRFSPDSQKLAYTTDHPVRLRVVDLNGAQLSVSPLSIQRGEPLWWQGGAAVPTPASLELAPDPIVTVNGGSPTQVLATLYDAGGNVISRAATGWTIASCNGGGPRVSHAGVVTPGPATESYGTTLCANNGGVSTCASLLVNPSNLSLGLSASPAQAVVGQDVTFTAMVTNNASSQLSSATITDQLPAQLQYVSSSSDCSHSNGTVTCNLGAMAANASRTVTIIAQPKQSGTITNTVSVAGPGADVNETDNSANAIISVSDAPPPVGYSSGGSVAIPDGDSAGADSPINVSGFAGEVLKVTVRLHITHPYVSDLDISLVAPDGTTIDLSSDNGSGGDNYGSDCPADGNDSGFDDSAATPVAGSGAPFIGTFRPEQQLAAFKGRSGAAVNGTWKLHVVDDASSDEGAIECWSLSLTPLSNPEPTPSPTPTATPTPTPPATPTPTPEPSASPTPIPSATPNTSPGNNVSVESPSRDAGVTFAQVTAEGATTFTPINPPSSAGAPPDGYSIVDDAPAYDITTTADYNGPITVCLATPNLTAPEQFNRARILHGESGVLVDRTVGRDFATKQVCARVPSLSPFVVAIGPPVGQLRNIATRLRVQSGENVLIGGLIVSGTEPKRVILRAIGPSLSQFFNGVLSDTTLELYQGDTLVASNDNWQDTQRDEIEATTIPPNHELESAIVQTLAPGSYTAVMSGKDGRLGIGVIEAYDLDLSANSKLANIASRGFVEFGDNVMIGGLIVGGNGEANTKVLVRAIGPSLGAAGVAGALQDPTLELRDGNGELVRENDNWQESQREEIEATTIAPSDPAEAAVVATLPPGTYTAVVRGKNDGSGVGLVEVYNLQ